jgi:hypothetical protein
MSYGHLISAAVYLEKTREACARHEFTDRWPRYRLAEESARRAIAALERQDEHAFMLHLGTLDYAVQRLYTEGYDDAVGYPLKIAGDALGLDLRPTRPGALIHRPAPAEKKRSKSRANR